MGPAAVITGAFIGPGTLTTTIQAGRLYGYALLWTVVFSGLASLVLMNMNTRLALVRQQHMIGAIYERFQQNTTLKYLILVALAFVALFSGLGFEAGNLMGASAGFVGFSGVSHEISILLLALICSSAILFSTPKRIEGLMKLFVMFMGLLFIVTAFLVKPRISDVIRGLRPTVPDGGLLITLALIGTTIIAINLIFHSLGSVERWTSKSQLREAKLDTALNLGIGIAITLSLIIIAAQLPFDPNVPATPLMFASALEVTLGDYGYPIAAFGLWCAGISSAIATPYMVGVIVERVFFTKSAIRVRKIVALTLVWLGSVFAYVQTSPVPFILAAQAFSGVMLPLIAYLIVSSTSRESMGVYVNTRMQKILGYLIVSVLIILGGRLIWNVFTQILS